MAEDSGPSLRGAVPGGRSRPGQLERKDYSYNGLGYDTLTESPGERAIRLGGKQQWRRVKAPGTIEVSSG